MILLDVNVLVHVHREDADRHEEYTLWLKRELVQPAGLMSHSLIKRNDNAAVFSAPSAIKQTCRA